MRILKIANITNSRNSGMGRVMHNSADALRDLGHTVDFLFSENVPRRNSDRGDRFVFPIALVRAIRKHINQQGPCDVVEIHEPSAAWYCHSRKYDKSLPPCVIMSHGLEAAQWQLRQKLDQALKTKTSRKSRVLVPLTLLSQANYGLTHCQQIMCLNTYDKRYLQKVLGVSSQNISLVQNGVSPLFFGGPPLNDRQVKSLLFVGSWLKRKGITTLVEAFASLCKKDAAFTLTLAGTGYGEREVLSSFPQDLRSQVCVIPSALDFQLRDIYHQHCIFVFPSYFEPWGLVLMEAAAAGMAIVTTSTGGPKDLFTHNENARLVEPSQPDQIVQSIWDIASNQALHERLGKNAQMLAKQFTWTAAAHSHLDAYLRALQVAEAQTA